MSGLLELHWERGKQFSLRFFFGKQTKYVETMPTPGFLKRMEERTDQLNKDRELFNRSDKLSDKGA